MRCNCVRVSHQVGVPLQRTEADGAKPALTRSGGSRNRAAASRDRALPIAAPNATSSARLQAQDSEMEEALLNLLKMSGFPNIKFEKKIDFEELYNKKFN